MTYLTREEKDKTDVTPCDDHGAGQPLIVMRGDPWSGLSLAKQVMTLVEAGYRVVACNRNVLVETATLFHQ